MHACTNSCGHACICIAIYTNYHRSPTEEQEKQCVPEKLKRYLMSQNASGTVPRSEHFQTSGWILLCFWAQSTRQQGCWKHKQINCGKWTTYKWLIPSPLLISVGIKSTGIKKKKHQTFEVNIQVLFKRCSVWSYCMFTPMGGFRTGIKSLVLSGKIFILGVERSIWHLLSLLLLLQVVFFLFSFLSFIVSANWPSQCQFSNTGTQTSLYNALATAGTVASLSS